MVTPKSRSLSIVTSHPYGRTDPAQHGNQTSVSLGSELAQSRHAWGIEAQLHNTVISADLASDAPRMLTNAHRGQNPMGVIILNWDLQLWAEHSLGRGCWTVAGEEGKWSTKQAWTPLVPVWLWIQCDRLTPSSSCHCDFPAMIDCNLNSEPW